MTTFALVHGSGDDGAAWRLVVSALRERGHQATAPDLPTDREDATWADCVATVVDAVGAAEDVVVVGQSAGGFVVPLVADRVGAVLQVYVAGMVPAAGESAGEWFGNVGWSDAVAAAAKADGGLTGSADPMVAFYHDVPEDLAHEAMARERATSEALGEAPWPGAALPSIPARYVVTTRDRFLPPPVQRQVAAQRLGITAPDTIDSGHCPHLSRPEELAGILSGYVREAGTSGAFPA
ncbi:alpha/beta fold hydrolase [Nocardioides sp. cx-173]|uniref:alpha/beta fold hydrolase n=1 Tax=Nocardioides sp. cx-173 TaxID=2898796 RepID=UPI001E44986A|nr:alpha/beta hydrolase [Nocardioides sp. cx-173]MCD4525463.1 alpha/beta hydrolase [Nocardioides sp. cx-173]UGB42609.1 alpha/beta hydrolase [Nocardioides sp. cx-173]